MAVTQANIDQLASLNAEFWYRNKGGVLTKAVVGDNNFNTNQPTSWQIKLINGAKFTSEKVIIVYDFASKPRNAELTKDASNDLAYRNMTTSGVNKITNFDFTTQASSPLYTINQDDLDLLASENVVMKIGSAVVALNSIIYFGDIVTLTANAGFKLRQAYFWDEYNNLSYFTIENNTGTFTPHDNTPLTGFTVSAIDNTPVDPDPVDPDPVDPDPVDPDPVDPDPVDPEPVDPKYPEFTYNEDMKAVIDDNYTKFYSNGVILNLGDIVYSGDLLEIKCNSGYIFSGSVKFIAYDDYNYTNDILFSINAGGTIATYTVNTDYSISSLELLTEQTDSIVGTGNIFKITEYQLQQINKDRFYSTPAPNVEVIDYGTNILGVIKLPFDISSDHIQNDELIRLGSHITTVSATKISTDKLVLDLGDIEVQAPSNLLDYSNTRVLLHLPYAPTMSLDIDYVLGYTINVEYIINLYDGNSTINIKSSKTNKVIASSTVDLGVNIPYSSDSGYSPTSNNTNVMMGGDNHIKSPFIEINRNIPLLADKFFTIPVIDESTLMGNIGFIQVENINLNVAATSNEKDMILLALKNGVIIK